MALLERIFMAHSYTSSSEELEEALLAEEFSLTSFPPADLAIVNDDKDLTGADILTIALSILLFFILQRRTLPKAPLDLIRY